MDWITRLGPYAPFLVAITAIIVGGVIAVVAVIVRYNERMAKIARGIDPDAAAPR